MYLYISAFVFSVSKLTHVKFRLFFYFQERIRQPVVVRTPNSVRSRMHEHVAVEVGAGRIRTPLPLLPLHPRRRSSHPAAGARGVHGVRQTLPVSPLISVHFFNQC